MQERVLEKRELYKERTSERYRVFINPYTCEETIQCQRKKNKTAKGQKRIAPGVHRGPKVVPVPNSHCGTPYNSRCIELKSKSVKDSDFVLALRCN